MISLPQAVLRGQENAVQGKGQTTAAHGEADLAAFLPGHTGEGFNLENLRRKINNEEYLYGAIQRIAQVLSGELLKVSRGGIYHERQRKRRK
ncbi:MAG: hypothetical protein LBQ46_11645 [Treponema sp.]|jgi:hypothetical protein|nr:hypothetical protein [Treponema sp.]